MKVFHCDHCGQPVFFENTGCLSCGHKLAYLPDLADMGSLEADGQAWRSPLAAARGRTYRLCRNYAESAICNWAVTADEPDQAFCRACRLTRVIPSLDKPAHKEWWYKLEVAKRRVVYSLLNLGLPVRSKDEDPGQGVAFEFLADSDNPAGTPVLTGHDNGVICINIAEADDSERERRRNQLHEPYRTLLGHIRHEIGHYYWDRLIAHSSRLDAFRALFGDERQDYGEALKSHYAQGPPADWQQRFVTSYSSAHPWEDWAETWAHYLHITDTLEMAAACGLSLRPRRNDEPALSRVADSGGQTVGAFDRMMASWFPVTYVLNNLNRGLGLSDGYPFVLSPPAIEKLRFVHETVGEK